MVSTHCELREWNGLDAETYAKRKAAMAAHLVACARRVYPRLGADSRVFELGTPVTYERYTGRPGGAVGGARLHPGNANQRAVPHDVGVRGFYLVGDGTWPGLGTVAACLASRDVAQRALDAHPRAARRTACVATKGSGIAPSA
jgi:phytoene dehydrogenase-like protein